jgi:hypothetical protein
MFDSRSLSSGGRIVAVARYQRGSRKATPSVTSDAAAAIARIRKRSRQTATNQGRRSRPPCGHEVVVRNASIGYLTSDC